MNNLSAQQFCPLCQKSNSCAMAQTENMASHCWCMDVKINPEILAQLTEAQRNVSCICQKCAGTLKAL